MFTIIYIDVKCRFIYEIVMHNIILALLVVLNNIRTKRDFGNLLHVINSQHAVGKVVREK